MSTKILPARKTIPGLVSAAFTLCTVKMISSHKSEKAKEVTSTVAFGHDGSLFIFLGIETQSGATNPFVIKPKL